MTASPRLGLWCRNRANRCRGTPVPGIACLSSTRRSIKEFSAKSAPIPLQVSWALKHLPGKPARLVHCLKEEEVRAVLHNFPRN